VFSFRHAGLADATAVGRGVAAGFEGYREFAPPFWRPPDEAAQIEHFRRLFGEGHIWCLLAEHEGTIAGQVSFVPASAGAAPVGEPGLAHLSGLFVEPRWWGGGLARSLHAAALEEAAARGYTAMRLFTPAGQARARRFYEREGWAQTGDARDIAGGLPSVEYRRGLVADRTATA
jgi:GNAT superfamily N-acetyltransferase